MARNQIAQEEHDRQEIWVRFDFPREMQDFKKLHKLAEQFGVDIRPRKGSLYNALEKFYAP